MSPPPLLPLLLLLLTLGMTTAQGPFHGGTTDRTLYKNHWPVVEVYGGNWTSTVVKADQSWVMVMYATWCGHCQRFAPTYTAMANSLHGWKNVVKFGAMACTHPTTEQICTDHGIVNYPTIKFYGPEEEGDGGTVYSGSDSRADIEKGLVEFLSTAEPVTDKSISLQPLRTIDDLLAENLGKRHRKILVFAETASPNKTCLGCYLILDVSNLWKKVVVRRIAPDEASNLGITEFPSLHSVNINDGSLTQIASHLDREGFQNAIRVDVLHLAPTQTTTPGTRGPTTTIGPVIIILPDGLHEQDLESGVYRSLWGEIGRHAHIQGRRLRIVKTHVMNMAKLLPLSEHVKVWLSRVHTWLQDKQNLTSGEWKTALKDLRDKDGYIPRRVIWTGCRGSSPERRGYPCSLWTIFHTMTVAAYNQQNSGISSKDVLQGMRDYITNFFGCSECSKHFARISANVDTKVTGGDGGQSAVKWLWRTHNAVNKRLHGDPTEDPAHPKMQFPTSDRCADCHSTTPVDNYEESDWVQNEVMEYLVDFYSGENVIRDSAKYTYIAPTVKSLAEVSDGGAVVSSQIGSGLVASLLLVALGVVLRF